MIAGMHHRATPSFTSPLAGEVGAERRERGPAAVAWGQPPSLTLPRKGGGKSRLPSASP
jgi:hypothetical protein